MAPGISSLKLAIPFRKGGALPPNGDCTLLTAITYSTTRINLAWTNGSTNEDGISIERSLDGVTFAEITTVAAGTSVYADTPLTEATRYYYRVRAFRGTLYSNYSNTADDTTWLTALTVAGTVEQTAPTKVDIAFGYNLDVTSVPDVSAFALTGKTITNVAIAGATVTLTVSVTYDWGDSVGNCIYTMPATNRLLRDSDKTELTSFTQAVTNNMTAPLILDDANHWWYDATDLATITKDGSNYVSVWAAKGGAATGKNLLQGSGTNQPLWVSPGTIRFDGTDNFLKALAFTWNQPTFVYILFKQITWTSLDTVFDGNNTSLNRLYQYLATPNLAIRASTVLSGDPDLELNTWGIIRTLTNGVNSKIQLNNNTAVTGDAGTAVAAGFTLGARGAADGAYSNIEVKYIVCVNIDDAANEIEIYNWLVTRVP